MLDPDWLSALVRSADAPPVQPRSPLRLLTDDGSPVIGTIEPAIADVLASVGVPIRDLGDAWRIEPPAGADAVFAAMARTLRDHQLAGAWRDELLAVNDEGDMQIGAIERAAVRPLGITTHAVHLIARRPDGAVWVQQRSSTKSTDPGRWDTTMGGLIAAGESLATALERETWEEAGLRTAAMHALRRFGSFTVRRPVAHGYMVERTELFEAIVDAAAVPVNQDGEVDRFDCLGPDELIERLHADAYTLEAALALAMWLQHRDGASR